MEVKLRSNMSHWPKILHKYGPKHYVSKICSSREKKNPFDELSLFYLVLQNGLHWWMQIKTFSKKPKNVEFRLVSSGGL